MLASPRGIALIAIATTVTVTRVGCIALFKKAKGLAYGTNKRSANATRLLTI